MRRVAVEAACCWTVFISTMPCKSSPVDCIPTSIIKTWPDVFAPLIAHLAKLSFTEGKFPSRYKTASVTPLLKKKDLDPDVAGSYRPISNLHTISKMLERLWPSRTGKVMLSRSQIHCAATVKFLCYVRSLGYRAVN